jgi:predicted transcriptional regulator
MTVISLRLKDKDYRRLDDMARRAGRDKSAVARDLLDQGLKFVAIKRYREGKLSLGSLAAELELSLGEAIDLLAEFGVESPLEYPDYLDGLKTLN